ncbi:MAG: LysE family translocator [Aggregatilineales bacterium]
MPDSTQLITFIIASMALLIVPGPAVLYIVTRSIDGGRRVGLVSVAGICTGTMVHVIAAAIGLSALLVSSALLFNLVKVAGAAYLIYLGVRRLMTKVDDDTTREQTEDVPKQLSEAYRQGVIVNLLNPKTALFFFAFLPQFADPARGALAPQVLFLGLLFVFLSVCSDSVYAILAGTAREWLRSSQSFAYARRYFAGAVYIVLGITTLLSGSDTGS